MQRLHEDMRAVFLIVAGACRRAYSRRHADWPYTTFRIHVLRNLDLPLVAAIISRSGLFIGNDSGITHMAAALGIPTVAVFGPTDPAVWAPRGKSVCIVRECDSDGQWRWPEPETVLRRRACCWAVDKERLLK